MYFDYIPPGTRMEAESEDVYYDQLKGIWSRKLNTDNGIKRQTLRDLVKQVAEMDSKDGCLRSNFVIEECAELIVEMARTYRKDKTSTTKIFGEACDVLATTFVVLYSLGCNEDDVRERIKMKYRSALEGKEGENV